MYAIIETGGKQYKVSDGDVIFVEKLCAADGEEITLDKVVALGDTEGQFIAGTPYVDGAAVTAKESSTTYDTAELLRRAVLSDNAIIATMTREEMNAARTAMIIPVASISSSYILMK